MHSENLNSHLVGRRAWEGHRRGGEPGVGGPAVPARAALAPEVILTLELPLPLLLGHHGVVITVVVKDLLA